MPQAGKEEDENVICNVQNEIKSKSMNSPLLLGSAAVQTAQPSSAKVSSLTQKNSSKVLKDIRNHLFLITSFRSNGLGVLAINKHFSKLHGVLFFYICAGCPLLTISS